MDRHFLEFWGNFLVNAAKEQKRLEDLSNWMQQGFKFKGFDDLTEMFRKFIWKKTLLLTWNPGKKHRKIF